METRQLTKVELRTLVEVLGLINGLLLTAKPIDLHEALPEKEAA